MVLSVYSNSLGNIKLNEILLSIYDHSTCPRAIYLSCAFSYLFSLSIYILALYPHFTSLLYSLSSQLYCRPAVQLYPHVGQITPVKLSIIKIFEEKY